MQVKVSLQRLMFFKWTNCHNYDTLTFLFFLIRLKADFLIAQVFF